MAADEQKAKDRTMDAEELSELELDAAAGGRIVFDKDGYYQPGNPQVDTCNRWSARDPTKFWQEKCCWTCEHFTNSHCEIVNIGGPLVAFD